MLHLRTEGSRKSLRADESSNLEPAWNRKSFTPSKNKEREEKIPHEQATDLIVVVGSGGACSFVAGGVMGSSCTQD
jgi:hypothetical protein